MTNEEIIKILFSVVEFYANPKTYDKIGFTFYRDSGKFADDYDNRTGNGIINNKPGDLARKTLKTLKEKKQNEP